MSLCKYKNVLGEPNTGIHSVRIFNIAIFDVISTVLVGVLFHQYIIVEWLKMSSSIKLWMVLLVFFALGILLHRLFCVRTTVDKLLFNVIFVIPVQPWNAKSPIVVIKLGIVTLVIAVTLLNA